MSKEPAAATAKPSKKGPAPDVAHRPFDVLLASAPPSMAGGYRSGLISIVFHGSVSAALILTTINSGAGEEESVTQIVEVVETTNLPPPPPPPPPPELAPEMPDVQRFSTLQMPTVILDNIPAPSLDFVFDASSFTGQGRDAGAANVNQRDSTEASPDNPSFTPMTVRPSITNVPEVQAALVREYPAVLRDAGIGGVTTLWLFIGTTGQVEQTRVFESSGFDAMDQAAANVANVMRFSPAYNRDQIVRVWVQIPIRFQVVN